MKVFCSDQRQREPTNCPNQATVIKNIKLKQVQLPALRSKASVTVTVGLGPFLTGEELTLSSSFWLLFPPPLLPIFRKWWTLSSIKVLKGQGREIFSIQACVKLHTSRNKFHGENNRLPALKNAMFARFFSMWAEWGPSAS